NDESVIFKSGNLTNLELLQLYNKHISPLAPVEDTAAVVPKTKSEKKARRIRDEEARLQPATDRHNLRASACVHRLV
ncbi:hypothetical protein L9F63_014254, partial [Diploptera punctata]